MRKQIEILTRQLEMMPKPAPFDGRVSERDYKNASYLLQRFRGVSPLSLKLEVSGEQLSNVHALFEDADTLEANCRLIVDTYHAQRAEELAQVG